MHTGEKTGNREASRESSSLPFQAQHMKFSYTNTYRKIRSIAYPWVEF